MEQLKIFPTEKIQNMDSKMDDQNLQIFKII